jgi:hypothetical protein
VGRAIVDAIGSARALLLILSAKVNGSPMAEHDPRPNRLKYCFGGAGLIVSEIPEDRCTGGGCVEALP